MQITLRTLLAGLTFLLMSAGITQAAGLPQIEVWKDPSCGCCVKWIDHLRQAGFDVIAHETRQLDDVRASLGMPDRYAACHSARVAGYAIEGHVPVADIKRLLTEKPKAIGLAVPGMPMGSPGMEGPYSTPFQTLLIDGAGQAGVFAEH